MNIPERFDTMSDAEVEELYCSLLLNLNSPREGMDKLLAYLKTTDFFTAPASARYHNSRTRGLVEHSLNVCRRLVRALYDWQARLPEEDRLGPDKLASAEDSAVVSALLHDICKSNFYRLDSRNRKKGSEWVKEPYYAVREDALNYGHGEESVYIAQAYIKIKREEAFAIRFHMGDFEDQNTSRAYEKYPLAIKLHVADLEATYLDEKRG